MANFDRKQIDDEKKAIESLKLSDEKIINKIFIESGKSYIASSTENIAKSVSYFAVLIHRLSVKSDKIQKRMLWLNYLIAALTIVLLLTIPQVNKFVFSFVENLQTHKEQANTMEQKQQNNHEDNNVSKNTHVKPPNK